MCHLKNLFWAFEMRRKSLDVTTVESHAGLNEANIALLQLPPFHRPFFLFSIGELHQARAVAIVDLAVGVPQARFCVLRRSRHKILKKISFTCCTVSELFSNSEQQTWISYFAIKTSTSA